MEVIRRLAGSRRFWLMLVAVVQTIVLGYLGVKPEVWNAINALLVVVIAAYTVDDTAEIISKK
jgi:Ca2+/H+ antiporter